MTAARWQSWDGRCLRWQVDATGTQVELWLDGVLFARLSGSPVAEIAFDIAPAGHAQMEFALRRDDGSLIAPTWRVRFGQAAVAGIDQWTGELAALQPLADAPLPDAQTLAQCAPVSIIIPIHNSAQIVQRCIESVLRWSTGNARLVLIDDASDEPAIADVLARYAGRQHVTLLRNTQNLGYTRTCNLGIGAAGDDDIVLLNADTEVGPRWLERLRLTAYADANTGTVTAVSDNAGAFSVPELERYCPIPARWSLVQTQRALLQQAGACLPQLPSGNGFCMYIKRAMLDRVGVLDADAFPCGYGEENDLCQRGERQGFRHVIAGDVFVRHVRSASFGEARRLTLGVSGMAVLRQRYPDYEEKVGATLWSFARRVLDYRVRRVYAAAQSERAVLPRPRVLMVADRADAIQRMAARIPVDYEPLALFVNEDGWQLLQKTHSGMIALDTCPSGCDCGQQLRQWLVRYAIELVHALDVLPPEFGLAAASVGVGVVDRPDDRNIQRLYDDAMLIGLAFQA